VDGRHAVDDENLFVARALKATIRIGVLLLLVVWCFSIVRPFLVPVAWGIIIAVASFGFYERLETLTGGRRALAGALYATLGLAVLAAPVALLGGTLVDGIRAVATGLEAGTVHIPPPPAEVADWPLIGPPIFQFWELASTNLQQALLAVQDQVTPLGTWLLGFVGAILVGFFQFVIAIFIATGLVMNAKNGARLAGELATSFAGPDGSAYAELATQTVRSVAKGILGVALVQSILAGIGFVVAGVPAAGLLALVCLILAIVQIGAVPVLVAVVIYQFTVMDTTAAVLFLAWCVVVGISDNILRPLLLGRGVDLPMLVIFIGAIGGVLTSGILGLFVGPVVLALGYSLLMAWVAEARAQVRRAQAE